MCANKFLWVRSQISLLALALRTFLYVWIFVDHCDLCWHCSTLCRGSYILDIQLWFMERHLGGCLHRAPGCVIYNIYDMRRHKTVPISGKKKHSKNNLKIYVIMFANFFMWCMYGQYCFLLYSVNKSAYIYWIILLFD